MFNINKTDWKVVSSWSDWNYLKLDCCIQRISDHGYTLDDYWELVNKAIYFYKYSWPENFLNQLEDIWNYYSVVRVGVTNVNSYFTHAILILELFPLPYGETQNNC